jgi:hypothetical protein
LALAAVPFATQFSRLRRAVGFARAPHLNLTLIHTPEPRFARWH